MVSGETASKAQCVAVTLSNQGVCNGTKASNAICTKSQAKSKCLLADPF